MNLMTGKRNMDFTSFKTIDTSFKMAMANWIRAFMQQMNAVHNSPRTINTMPTFLYEPFCSSSYLPTQVELQSSDRYKKMRPIHTKPSRTENMINQMITP